MIAPALPEGDLDVGSFHRFHLRSEGLSLVDLVAGAAPGLADEFFEALPREGQDGLARRPNPAAAIGGLAHGKGHHSRVVGKVGLPGNGCEIAASVFPLGADEAKGIGRAEEIHQEHLP